MFGKLISILKENPKKIVFTEGTDPRILEASVGALMIIIYLSRRKCALRFYPVKLTRKSMQLTPVI